MIRIKKIPMAYAKVGMKVAHSVHTELGALLVQKDTVLDHRHLKTLRSLGIQSIEIFVEEDDVQVTSLDNIGYTTVIKEVKSFLIQIKQGEHVELTALTDIVEGVKEIRRNQDIVFCLSERLGSEYYIYSHSVNVALLAMMIGRWMKLSEKNITQLIYAGVLHDIGKLKVDSNILNKPGKLTPEEFDEIKKHPSYGFRMVEPLKFVSTDIKHGVLFHHEREDGSGYPTGIKSQKIPLTAKILAVADIYDAMTSSKVYSEEKPAFRVFKMMEDQSYGKLDYSITQLLLTNIANYYLGHKVLLNNGDRGEIVFINPNRVSRPIIKCGNRFVDLSMDTSVQIERMSSLAETAEN